MVYHKKPGFIEYCDTYITSFEQCLVLALEVYEPGSRVERQVDESFASLGVGHFLMPWYTPQPFWHYEMNRNKYTNIKTNSCHTHFSGCVPIPILSFHFARSEQWSNRWSPKGMLSHLNNLWPWQGLALTDLIIMCWYRFGARVEHNAPLTRALSISGISYPMLAARKPAPMLAGSRLLNSRRLLQRLRAWGRRDCL